MWDFSRNNVSGVELRSILEESQIINHTRNQFAINEYLGKSETINHTNVATN